MAEYNISLAILSEPPYKIRSSSTCFLSKDGTAGILWRPGSNDKWICRSLACGEGFVIAKFGTIKVASCYNLFNVKINTFTRYLDELRNVLAPCMASILVCGDFNAHSVAWGSSTGNRRGEIMERWSAALDLRLLNVGAKYTCVRPQGSSIVDLSWSSPDLVSRIVNWSVLEEVETLSDHVYIEIKINSLDTKTSKVRTSNRWNFMKLETELFLETLEMLANAKKPENLEQEPEKYVNWLTEIMTSACNVAAPIIKNRNNKRQMY